MFARLDKWTPYRTEGSWPDADMLPLGIIRFDKPTRLTHDEQILCMTLWAIARSPLILGADMTKLDPFTLSLLTNDEVLAVNQHSAANRQLFNHNGLIAWIADVPGDPNAKYLALFNTTETTAEVSVDPRDLGFTDADPIKVRDLWQKTDLPSPSDADIIFAPHGAGLYRVSGSAVARAASPWVWDLDTRTNPPTATAKSRAGSPCHSITDLGSHIYFSAQLPEGNYRVAVTFSGTLTVKAELRRLMLENATSASAGQMARREFIVNIRQPAITESTPEKRASTVAQTSSLPDPSTAIDAKAGWKPALRRSAPNEHDTNPQARAEVDLKPRERAEEKSAWDDQLTLEFSAPALAHGNANLLIGTPSQAGGASRRHAAQESGVPIVRSIEISPANDVPTLFLLGDSTVCDQPLEPYASWGQMLPRFFAPDIAVANHAESGETYQGALDRGRLAKVLSQLRPGDYVMMQFGHNDMKVVDVPTYKASIEQFVSAIRAKNAGVILVTQVQRRTFDANGKVTNSHKGYPDAVREVAREQNVPLIDLHAMSTKFYEALGKDGSAIAFKSGDGTHHNAYGAYELAKCVIESLREIHHPLAAHIAPDFKPFDPAKPDAPDSINIPASPTAPAEKPDGS